MSVFGLILLIASASIIALGTGLGAYVRIQGKAKHLQARFENVMSAYGRTSVATTTLRQKTGPQVSVWFTRLARIFGYKADQAYMYTVKWYVIPLVALAPARIAAWIFAGLVGNASLLAMPILWLVMTRAGFKWFEHRYMIKLLVQFPDALAMLVRAVRVGIPVNVGIQSIAQESPPETAREFQRAAEQLAVGNSVEDAVAEMAEHSRITEYRFFATALALQSQTGGGLSETLENLADVIRKRVAMRARGNALASEAKTSAGILAALPFLTCGGLMVLNPEYGGVLFNEFGGRMLLAVAAILLTSGILMMRYMIRKSLS